MFPGPRCGSRRAWAYSNTGLDKAQLKPNKDDQTRAVMFSMGLGVVLCDTYDTTILIVDSLHTSISRHRRARTTPQRAHSARLRCRDELNKAIGLLMSA